MVKLYDWQEEALGNLKSGSILYGDVGSGKSLTSLEYYVRNWRDKPLYIITTAKKRDSKEWERDCEKEKIENAIVDSWNNILRYKDVLNAFFIFDEQRVVGSGTWAKTFIKIAHKNYWILLSGTPGDTWSDYIPIFVANRFYNNKTDFTNQHIEFDRFAKFPKIKKYHNEGKLLRLRRQILVRMEFERNTTRNYHNIIVDYDKALYDEANKDKWNPYTEEPIKTPSEYASVCRRIVAESQKRQDMAYQIMMENKRLIVFYNQNYERDILVDLADATGKATAEWNGRKHEEIPDTPEWIYIVQYTAGAEGWNCTMTDSMLFYSLNYSWKMKEQAEGRIDRLDTLYTDLHYTYLISDSVIDKHIKKAIEKKRKFNASTFGKKVGGIDVRE